MEVSKEDQVYIDDANGYYLGLWNILLQANCPTNIIIDSAINNLLTILDKYMDDERKMELLTIVVSNIEAEVAKTPKSVQ